MRRLIPIILLAAGLLFSQNPVTPQMPGSAPTDADLGVQANSVSTYLTNGINNATTSIPVADASRVLNGMFLRIRNEVVRVESKAGNILTVTRAFDGTSAYSHSAFTPVVNTNAARYHNAVAAEVKAISTYLLANPIPATMALSVTDYGAVCDGVADDTAEIQAAVDAAETAGGGNVFFPGGTCLISAPIVISSDTTLFGEGSVSIIKAATGFTGNYMLVNESYSAGADTNITIRNLHVDGSKASVASIAGISFQKIDGVQILDVEVRDCNGNGIYIGPDSANITLAKVHVSGSGDDGADTFLASNIQFLGATADYPNSGRIVKISMSDVTSTDSYAHGVVAQFVDAITIVGGRFYANGRGRLVDPLTYYGNGVTIGQGYGVQLIGVVSDTNEESGFDVAAKDINVQISGCTAHNNGLTGIFVGHTTGKNYTITGNTVTANGGNGIWVSDTLSNIVVSSNVAEANTLDGIYLDAVSEASVTGNTARSNGAYGIHTETTSSNIIISGNICNNNTTANTNFSGTNVEHFANFATPASPALITNLTVEAAPVGSTDYVMIYNAASSALRRVLLNNLPGSVNGGTNLTTANRMVAVDSAATVKELSTVTYDAVRDAFNAPIFHTTPSASDPASLSDGDIWTTIGGAFRARLAGATANVIAGANISFATSVLQVAGGVTASANGAKYGFGAGNPAGTDTFGFGWSSSAYTTGGVDLWLPNSTPFVHYPAATPFRVGVQAGAATDYVSFDGGIVAPLVLRLRPIAGDYGSPGDADIWYNSTAGKFRCRENGVTVDCIGASGSGLVQFKLNGVNIGSPRSNFDIQPGSYMVSVPSDDGTNIDFPFNVDDSKIATRANVQAGSSVFCNDTSGSSANYTCTLSPALASYTTGMVMPFRPQTTSAAGALTVNAGPSSINIKQLDGTTDPGAGALVAGQGYLLFFDGTVFRVIAGLPGGGGLSAIEDDTSPTLGGTLDADEYWVNNLSGINITPTSLPGSPTTGDTTLDSADENKLKTYSGGRWITQTAEETKDPNYIYKVEDFCSPAGGTADGLFGTHRWWRLQNSGTVSFANAADSATSTCRRVLAMGATANGVGGVYLIRALPGFWTGTTGWDLRLKVALDTTDDIMFMWGPTMGLNVGNTNNTLAIIYDASASANWRCKADNAGTSSFVDTGVAATTDPVVLRIWSDVVGEVRCSVDGTAGASALTTNFPTSSSYYAQGFGIATQDSTAKSATVHWAQMRVPE